jgi:fluoroquinolone resistance protein
MFDLSASAGFSNFRNLCIFNHSKWHTKTLKTEMEQVYIENKIFDKNDFVQSPLAPGEYENCTFLNCDFSNSDLSNILFIECEFVDCNLSLVKLIKTVFRDVKFKGNKMLGLRFEDCDKFGLAFSFDNCNLNNCSFYQTKLKGISFKNSQIHEADFTECDLTGSLFENCDLSGATFENTIIEKADLRTSFNYSIDPDLNRIKKAKFSLNGIAGLLGKYEIEIDGSSNSRH